MSMIIVGIHVCDTDPKAWDGPPNWIKLVSFAKMFCQTVGSKTVGLFMDAFKALSMIFQYFCIHFCGRFSYLLIDFGQKVRFSWGTSPLTAADLIIVCHWYRFVVVCPVSSLSWPNVIRAWITTTETMWSHLESTETLILWDVTSRNLQTRKQWRIARKHVVFIVFFLMCSFSSPMRSAIISTFLFEPDLTGGSSNLLDEGSVWIFGLLSPKSLHVFQRFASSGRNAQAIL